MVEGTFLLLMLVAILLPLPLVDFTDDQPEPQDSNSPLTW